MATDHTQPASILVVDDDEDLRRVISFALKSDGHHVSDVGSGEEALKRMEHKHFDILVMDVWMPGGMSGLDVLTRLAKRRRRPRVVMMTGDQGGDILLGALRQQAEHFIGKPFEASQLQMVVKELLASAPIRSIEVVSATPDWVELLVPCQFESVDRIQSFLMALKSDVPQAVRASVGQAFRELLFNAIEWGGKLDPDQHVRIAFLRTKRMLLYRIADPGPGFRMDKLEHAAIGNPGDPEHHINVREEKGIRPGGFGLLMTQSLVDELVYNEARNEVVFIKYLDETEAETEEKLEKSAEA